MTKSIFLEKPALSVRKQFLAVFLACAVAVVLPQLCHLIGKLTGTGMMIGTVLSPMHFPIIFVGLVAGPIVGAISGILAPLVSFALTGMPLAKMLPLMVVELFGYGLAAGFLRNIRLNNFVKVFITMIFGRVLRFLACLFMFYALSKTEIGIFEIWQSIPKCLPGIILQLILLPLLLNKFDSDK